MITYKTEFRNTIDYPWIKMDPINIGEVPKILGTPEMYCTVKKDDSAHLLINIYLEYSTTFKDAIIWNNYIAIGFCDLFYLIDIETHSSIYARVDGYFGYIYPYEEFILVATCFNILCFNKNCTLLWTSDKLGFDGVLVHDFDGKYIYGAGEYDPPGGWEDFVIDCKTGKRV